MKSNFTPECLGIGNQSISCSFYIFHLHLLNYEYINGVRAGWDLNAVPNLKLGER